MDPTDNRFLRGAVGVGAGRASAPSSSRHTVALNSSNSPTENGVAASSSRPAINASMKSAITAKIANLEGYLATSEERLKQAETQVHELKSSAVFSARDSKATAAAAASAASAAAAATSRPEPEPIPAPTQSHAPHAFVSAAAPDPKVYSSDSGATENLLRASPTPTFVGPAPPVPPPRRAGSSIKVVQTTTVVTTDVEIASGEVNGVDLAEADASPDVDALKFCLSLLHGEDTGGSRVDVAEVQKIHDKLSAVAKKTEQRLQLIREMIAEKEREWIKGAVSSDEDFEGLFLQSTRGWPVWNNLPEELQNINELHDEYKYDFFISYRASSESFLARELRLRLMKLGYTVFLDQENLEDGENWQKGFVSGLKSSRVVVFLVSASALDLQRVGGSVSAVDNMLLEWETAMAAEALGFCSVFPVFIGSGAIDITKYPKERFQLFEKTSGTELFCRQSAYSTLLRLNSIENRAYLSHPERGWTADVLKSVEARVIKFHELFESQQLDKARLYFQELSEKIFGQEPGDSLSAAWFGRTCTIEPLSADSYSKVHLILHHNKFWRIFNISRQTPKVGKQRSLLDLLMKALRVGKPEEIQFSWSATENKVELREIKAISSSLQENPDLKTLNFSYNQFEDDAAEELVKWIGSLPNLSDLYLRNVSADQYPLITETLRSLEESRISTLRIWGVRNSNNKDEVTDFQSALIDLLQSSKTLKQLKIGWDGDLVPLAEALLENRSIEQFIFAFVRNMAGVAKFFEMTSKHPTLHNIELYSAPSLGRPFSQSLAHPGSIRKATFKLKEGDGETPENLWKALQTNNTLEEIHISVGAVNELDVGGPDKLKLVSFAQGLGSTSSLRVLDFSEINYAHPCAFDESSEVHLFDGLKANKTLEVLNLESCGITEAGVSKVLGGLSGHPKLNDLNLSSLRITPSFSKLLKSLVRSCPKLQILRLNDNPLGNEPVKALSEEILHHPILEQLHLDFVHMDGVGAEYLSGVVASANCLKALHIEGNEIGWPGAQALAEAAKRSTTLSKLQVGFAIIKESAEQFINAMTVNKNLCVKMANMWSAGLDVRTRESFRALSLQNARRKKVSEEIAYSALDYTAHNARLQSSAAPSTVIKFSDDPSPTVNVEKHNDVSVHRLHSSVLSLASKIKDAAANLVTFQEAKAVMDVIDAALRSERDSEQSVSGNPDRLAVKALKPRKSTETMAKQTAESSAPESQTLQKGEPSGHPDSADKAKVFSRVAFLTNFSPESQMNSLESAIIRELILRLDLETVTVPQAADAAEVEGASANDGTTDGKVKPGEEPESTEKDKATDSPGSQQQKTGSGGQKKGYSKDSSGKGKVKNDEDNEQEVGEEEEEEEDDDAEEEEDEDETDEDDDDDDDDDNEDEDEELEYVETSIVSTVSSYTEAYRFIDPNASSNTVLSHADKPHLYVVILSESTIDSFTQSKKSLVLVLNTWDALLKSSSRGRCQVVPVFIGSNIDGFQRKLKFALYKALQSGTPFDSKTLLRGLQVITHLFRLQGLFYMDSSSCEAIIFRITYVLENFIQTSSRRFKKLEAAFAQIWGFYGDMSELLEATYLGPPPVTDESVNALVELLPHFRLVKEIWISLANKTSDSDDEKNRNAGPPHTQGGLDRIVDGLQDNDSATSVTLITPPRYRSEQALAKLADCLRSLAWTSLSLTMNFERVTDVSEFGDALGKNRDLKHLSLIGNSKGLRFLRVQDYLGLRAQGIQALSEGLKKNNTLESLEIENNGVDAQGARVLSYALQSHPSLTRLSLAGNHLGMDGAKIIIDRLCLPRGALVELDLSSNVLGSNCDQIFVPLIQSTKSLRHLNIAGVDAGSKAMIPIFEALSSNRSITEFNCGENSIDDQALPALELVLRNNRTLKTLRLHANMLKDSGRLGALIASNTTLESLDIEANEYGSYLPFFESLVFNQTLQTLVIGAGDTNITLEELPQLLTAAVQRMPTLRSLTVSGLISTTNYKALRRSWIAVSGRDEADLVCTVAEHEGDVVQDWDDNDDDDSDQPNDKL